MKLSTAKGRATKKLHKLIEAAREYVHAQELVEKIASQKEDIGRDKADAAVREALGIDKGNEPRCPSKI